MSWNIECIVVGPIQCNCYILSDSISGKALIVDPGAESEDLLGFLQRKKFDLGAVLITHAHIDHVGGIEMVHKEFPSPVFYHAGDRVLYENLKMQAQFFGVTPGQLGATQPVVGDSSLEDNRVFSFSTGEVRVIHTPGHTPGSVCFHAQGELQAVFTGDTLFEGSLGRTDLWGGSYEQILESIHRKLLTLPENLKVLPGHGEPTTVGQEKSHNPFLV